MKTGNKLKEMSKQQKVSRFNLVQDKEEIVWELDDDDDDDAFDHPNITYNCSYPRPLEQYYEDLIYAYTENYRFFYKYLKRSPVIVFICEELASYFNKELASYFNEEPALEETNEELPLKETHKKRKVSKKNIKALPSNKTPKKPDVSKKIIKVLHSIHCLNSNRRSLPSVCENILVGYVPQLCSFNLRISNNSFCFLILKIAADIFSDIFANHPTKESDTCQKLLVAICCKAFHDISIQLSFVHFYAISVYLSVGIEMLSATFYRVLKAYFRGLFGDPLRKENKPGIVSQNVLSSHCILKVWDEIAFFYECWVKYCFIDPHIIKNKVKFKTLVGPDLSILKNSFIRFKMRHEYIHFKECYVPCEYPIISNSPSYLKNLPSSNESYHFFSFKEMYFNLGNIVDEIIRPGYCEKCKKNKCSCIKPLKKKARKKDARKKDKSLGIYNNLEIRNISYRVKESGSSSSSSSSPPPPPPSPQLQPRPPPSPQLQPRPRPRPRPPPSSSKAKKVTSRKRKRICTITIS